MGGHPWDTVEKPFRKVAARRSLNCTQKVTLENGQGKVVSIEVCLSIQHIRMVAHSRFYYIYFNFANIIRVKAYFSVFLLKNKHDLLNDLRSVACL